MPNSTSTERSKSRHLKNWVILPKFQLTVVLGNIITLVIGYVIVGVSISQTFKSLQDMGASVGLPKEHVYFQFISSHLHILLKNVAIGGGLAITGSFLITIVISHRLAGSLVRLKHYFKKIKEDGKINNPLNFRKGDYMVELADDINQALDGLKK